MFKKPFWHLYFYGLLWLQYNILGPPNLSPVANKDAFSCTFCSIAVSDVWGEIMTTANHCIPSCTAGTPLLVVSQAERKKECVSNNAICYCAHGRYTRRELIKGHTGQLWHIRAWVLPQIRIRLWLKTRPRGVRMESKMLIGNWDSRNVVRLSAWKSKPHKSKSCVALLLQHQHCCSVPWHYCLK